MQTSQPRHSTTHRERFIHFTDLDQVYFPRFNAVTAFVREEKMKINEDESKVWQVSFGFCHVSDQFCRRIGRQAARRRYFDAKNPVFIIMGPEKPTYDDIEEVLIQNYSEVADSEFVLDQS